MNDLVAGQLLRRILLLNLICFLFDLEKKITHLARRISVRIKICWQRIRYKFLSWVSFCLGTYVDGFNNVSDERCLVKYLMLIILLKISDYLIGFFDNLWCFSYLINFWWKFKLKPRLLNKWAFSAIIKANAYLWNQNFDSLTIYIWRLMRFWFFWWD